MLNKLKNIKGIGFMLALIVITLIALISVIISN